MFRAETRRHKHTAHVYLREKSDDEAMMSGYEKYANHRGIKERLYEL